MSYVPGLDNSVAQAVLLENFLSAFPEKAGKYRAILNGQVSVSARTVSKISAKITRFLEQQAGAAFDKREASYLLLQSVSLDLSCATPSSVKRSWEGRGGSLTNSFMSEAETPFVFETSPPAKRATLSSDGWASIQVTPEMRKKEEQPPMEPRPPSRCKERWTAQVRELQTTQINYAKEPELEREIEQLRDALDGYAQGQLEVDSVVQALRNLLAISSIENLQLNPTLLRLIEEHRETITDIEELTLKGCFIGPEISVDLQKLSWLLEQCPNVQIMDLSGSPRLTFSAVSPLLAPLPLFSLSLEHCPGVFDTWESMTDIPLHPVECLDISHNQFSPEVIADIAMTMPDLYDLNVSYTSGWELGVAALEQMTTLQVLDLSSTHVVKGLPGLTSVTSLKLCNTDITAPEVHQILGHCTSLEQMDLRGCPLLVEAEMQAVRRMFPHVTFMQGR